MACEYGSYQQRGFSSFISSSQDHLSQDYFCLHEAKFEEKTMVAGWLTSYSQVTCVFLLAALEIMEKIKYQGRKIYNEIRCGFLFMYSAWGL